MIYNFFHYVHSKSYTFKEYRLWAAFLGMARSSFNLAFQIGRYCCPCASHYSQPALLLTIVDFECVVIVPVVFVRNEVAILEYFIFKT